MCLGNTTQLQRDFNTEMSRVRQCVEWAFGKVDSVSAFQDFKKNLKVRLSPVGLYFPVATVLTNMHSCLYENQTADYFGISTPLLEEYTAAMNPVPLDVNGILEAMRS
jgi:hypothetical protein